METIDSDRIVDAHAAIADRAERVRQVNTTLGAIEELRMKLVGLRRRDLTELVHQGLPEPPRGALSEVAERVGMGKGRVSEIIHPPKKRRRDSTPDA